MNYWFVILWMLFNHVLDDYFLQGCLANLKQRSYWIQNAPEKMYQYDHIMALFMHSISWTFMIMLPVAYYVQFNIPFQFVIVFICNVLLHMVIDDLKANEKKINLCEDQCFHLFQILLTAICAIK